MADEITVKISELPGAGVLTGIELVPLVQDGVTKTRSIQNIVSEGVLKFHTDASDPHDQYAFRVLNNLSATTDPSANNDSSEGYAVLSRWVNISTAEIWLCVGSEVGNANWQTATLSISDLGSAAVANTGAGNGLDADLLDGKQGTFYLDRSSHTGTQPASTITGLADAATTTVSTIRAGTTKGNVGLSAVDNYSRAHYDGRYLATDAKAADSDKLDGRDISQLVAVRSKRDFANGTLIATSISGTNGPAWLLHITGNSYGVGVPTDVRVQGYNYNDTHYSKGAISNPGFSGTIKAMSFEGKLCFWFPRISYWQGFDATIYDVRNAGYVNNNAVVSITDTGLPSEATHITDIPVRTLWDSESFNPTSKANTTGTYALRATGTTKSDVGLSNVGNYSRAHFDSRYLAAAAKAVDSNKLDGLDSTQFVRSDSDNTITGKQRFTDEMLWSVSSSNDALQRADARSESDQARLHWYGKDQNGGTQAFKHAWYDGSGYVSVTAVSGGITFGGDLIAAKFYGSGTGLTGTASLRATGTTKSDVGLANVDNYSRDHFDGRYLATDAKAADSNKLDGINSSQFVRSDANDTVSGLLTFTHANPQDMKRGISGGYGDSNGSGSNWGVNIWGMGDAYAGTGAGTSFSTGGYQLAWLRSSHSSANAAIGEGLYLYSQNAYRGGFGDNGADFPYGITTTDIVASGNITAYSDKRLKKDLVVIPTATDKVKQLAGYTYTNINNGSRNTGVVAQEVQKVLPEAVHEDDDGMLSVAYGNMVGLLIESIKEQQIQIDELKRRIG